MARYCLIGLGFAAALFLPLALGCSGGRQSEPAASAPPANSAAVSEEQATINEVLAKMSPADREVAEQQKICPVSEEPLGAMGTPIKVTVDGRDVFVCCEGCIDELKGNFDKYVAKLDKQP